MKSNKKFLGFTVAIIIAIIFVASFVSITFLNQNKAEAHALSKTQHFWILEDSTKLKAGPTSESKTVTTLGVGTPVTAFEKVTRNKSNWFHIRTAHKFSGWVPSQDVTQNPPVQPKTTLNQTFEVEPPPLQKPVAPTQKPVTTVVVAKPTTPPVKATTAKSTAPAKTSQTTKPAPVTKPAVKPVTPVKPTVLLDVRLISQLPELPLGCEVTSLAMMLNYAGVQVDKITLAKQIKTVPLKDSEGYYGHPDDGFVGNMWSKEAGYGPNHGPVFDLAKQYLGGRAVDLTGQSFDAVIHQLDNGKPVWVIHTFGFAPVPESRYLHFNTRKGQIKINQDEHSITITGYDANYIYFNDPYATIKNRKAPRTAFINAWKQFGSQAISYN